MKNSKDFKEWQKDFNFLTQYYNISSNYNNNESADVFTQILQAADSVPAEMEKVLGRQTSESMQRFLKTCAHSLFELHNLIKIALNLNLISIDEYHLLSKSLNEISRITKRFMKTFSDNQKISEKKLETISEDLSFWALN